MYILQYFNIMYAPHQLQFHEPYPYIEAADYTSLQSIIQTFPHLKNLNSVRDWSRQKFDGAVIRSANDDNVHKAIKYGIWATTAKNRTKLNQLFLRARSENREVYLFFSVVKSGMFEGVARLVSAYSEENFPFWWEDFNLKFKGYFKIEWVYLKDINYQHFEGLYGIDSQQVVKCKDCDLLDHKTVKKMLEIFQNKPIKNKWIFNDFDYMDRRERQYTRPQQQNNVNYQMPDLSGYGYMSATMGGYMNYNSQMMPLPPQMMKPMNQEGVPSHADLGFQMNPISKNRKK